MSAERRETKRSMLSVKSHASASERMESSTNSSASPSHLQETDVSLSDFFFRDTDPFRFKSTAEELDSEFSPSKFAARLMVNDEPLQRPLRDVSSRPLLSGSRHRFNCGLTTVKFGVNCEVRSGCVDVRKYGPVGSSIYTEDDVEKRSFHRLYKTVPQTSSLSSPKSVMTERGYISQSRLSWLIER